MKKVSIALGLLAIIVVLSGCIKIPIGDGQTLKLSKGGVSFSDSEGKETNFELDEDSESISMSNDDGDSWDASFGEDVELPEDFPAHFLPIPKEANIISVQQMDMEDGNITTISYQHTGDIEELADMYLESFEKNNFDLLEHVDFSEELEYLDLIPIHGMKDDITYMVQLIDTDEDGVQVSIMYGDDNNE